MASPSLDRIGRDHIPPHLLCLYGSLQTDLRKLLAFSPSFSRPAPKQPRSVGSNKFVQRAGERTIEVDDNRLQHFLAALDTLPPRPVWQDKYSLPDACKQAIRCMLAKRSGLRKWRLRQVEQLKSIAKRAKPIDVCLKRIPAMSCAPHALERVRTVNVAMLCLCCDVLQHPDVDLPRNYLHGFPVVGVIPDSGVLRSCPPTVTEEDFWAGYHALMLTNDAWAQHVASVVHDSRQRARGKHLDMLRTAWANTKDEIRQGLCGKPLTLAQLRQKYGSGTAMQCRVLQRHPIAQGLKQDKHADGSLQFLADGSPALVEKIRLIDDSKRSQHNDILMRCSETIAPCSFTYLSFVCAEVVDQARDVGLRMLPQIVFSTDDMKAAYRQVPTRQPEMCIVCLYSFDKGNLGPRFVEVWGQCPLPAPSSAPPLFARSHSASRPPLYGRPIQLSRP